MSEEETGGGMCLCRQREPPSRGEIDRLEHADDERETARLQGFLDGPEGIARLADLDDEKPLRCDAEGCEARCVRRPQIIHLTAHTAPQDRARIVLRFSEHHEAAGGKCQRERPRGTPYGIPVGGGIRSRRASR